MANATRINLSAEAVYITEAGVSMGSFPILIEETFRGSDGYDTRKSLCDFGSALMADAAGPKHWIRDFYPRLVEVLKANRAYLLGKEGVALAAELQADREVAENARRHGMIGLD